MRDAVRVRRLRHAEQFERVEQEGNEVDVLANVIVYFQQIAVLIGESFGLERFQPRFARA